MRYRRGVLHGLTVCLLTVGCQSAPAAPPDPVPFHLGEPFSLPAGQGAVSDADELRVNFDRVLTDSRCPAQVECFWTGEARIAVVVAPRDAEETTVEFNTNPAPGLNKQTADVGPYTIGLVSLDPYPETPAPIPFSDYRAVLQVTKP